MAYENAFFFYPCFLNLVRGKPDFYDESRYKTVEELAAMKNESECTKKFAKQIIFERIKQMRINAIQSIIDKRKFVSKKLEVSDGMMPDISQSEIIEKGSSKVSKSSSQNRSSQRSKGSKKSVSSQGYVTTTTTTTVTRVIEENVPEIVSQTSSGKRRTTTTRVIEEIHDEPQVEKQRISEREAIPFTDQSEFEQKFLEETNKYRRKHDSPPLSLNKELCNYAQEWANICANKSALQHRSNSPYGENLYASQGYTVDGGTAVKSWYDEIEYYNFNNPVFSSNTGHFTQVVWKSTTEMGVGMAVKRGWTFVVANYNPPGNYRGKFRENVLKMKRK